jgi:hypothetical protein
MGTIISELVLCERCFQISHCKVVILRRGREISDLMRTLDALFDGTADEVSADFLQNSVTPSGFHPV